MIVHSRVISQKGYDALIAAYPLPLYLRNYSVFKGQKEYQSVDKTFTNTVYLTMILAVLFMLAGMFFSENLARLLRADGEVFSMTKTYLQVILLFAPAFMLNDVFLCFIRNDGNPRLSMAAMLIGSLSNIILDYLFIFPLHMGIFGAVLATGFAPMISMCILSGHFFAKQNHFHFLKIKPSLELTANIVLLGLPSFITEAASGIVMIAFNYIILRLQGNIGVAAYGVVANLSLVVMSVYTGIAQGIQPITSRAYGYGKDEEVNKILEYAVVTVLIISAGIYLVFLLCADPLVNIFNSEQNQGLQRIAVNGLRLYFTAVPFAGFNIILSTHFASTEKVLPAQMVSVSRGFVVILPMAFFLSYVSGMTGVWLSFPITELAVSLMGVILYQCAYGKENHSDKDSGNIECRRYLR